MELQELKSVWKSVEPQISQFVQCEHTVLPQKKLDIKSRLLRRNYIGIAFSSVGFIAMVSFTLWGPALFPIGWSVAICVFVLINMIAGLYLANLIRHIKPWNDTHTEIMNSIIQIKKYYRNIELYISGTAILLFGAISFTPHFFNSWRMVYAWGLILFASVLEYKWYKKNSRYINQLENWSK